MSLILACVNSDECLRQGVVADVAGYLVRSECVVGEIVPGAEKRDPVGRGSPEKNRLLGSVLRRCQQTIRRCRRRDLFGQWETPCLQSS